MGPTPLNAGKLAAARLWAAGRMPYLASAVFACTPRGAPGTGTIAVDRSWRIHADPEVVAALEVSELGRLLVHLTGHLVRDHAARAETLLLDDDRRAVWARCVDAEINDDLAAGRCVPQVAATVPTDLGQSDGKLAESYLAALRDADVDVAGWDCGSGADGAERPWDGQGDAPMSAHHAELLRLGVANDIKRAERSEPGSVPGGWLRWADSVQPSRTDWRRLLDAELRRACAAVAGNVDYTYRRLSRRSHSAAPACGPRVVLPSLVRPVPRVAVVCDTSGSMDDALLQRALAEIERMLTRGGLRAAGVPVLAVDTEVHAMRRVNRADQVQLAGGGGTDMGAGIEAAAGLRPRPDVVVVLTDGMTPWPDDPPRGIRVVVGVLAGPGGWDDPDLRAPDWARTVVIDEV